MLTFYSSFYVLFIFTDKIQYSSLEEKKTKLVSVNYFPYNVKFVKDPWKSYALTIVLHWWFWNSDLQMFDKLNVGPVPLESPRNGLYSTSSCDTDIDWLAVEMLLNLEIYPLNFFSFFIHDSIWNTLGCWWHSSTLGISIILFAINGEKSIVAFRMEVVANKRAKWHKMR